jgi:hypothetical protein
LSGQFAMVVSPALCVPAGQSTGEAGPADAGGLLAQAAAGPGFWEELLGELRRAGLIAELLADGAIVAAVAQAGHGHKLNRALTAEVTAMCVIVGPCSRTRGMDLVLARTFAMPGLPVKPDTVTPSGPALSKARALLGEQVMRRIETGAAHCDADLGISAIWHGVEVTGIDGYHDGENTLADELEGSFTAGILNTAGRGFFSMYRWIRFSARGAHLVWRVKNGAKSAPFRTLRTLKDGSELVLLRESGSMLSKRRREHGDKTLTAARTPSRDWSASPSPPVLPAGPGPA